MAEQKFIDANNLIEEIREERCYNCRNFKDMKCDYCSTADYIYMIEDMPAADVAPVRHGRWEEASDGDGIACPFCRTDFCTIIYDTEYFNYCPNCGAKMGEKENDK